MPTVKYNTAEEKVAKAKEYQRAYYERNKERIMSTNRARYVPVDPGQKKRAGRPRYADVQVAPITAQ